MLEIFYEIYTKILDLVNNLSTISNSKPKIILKNFGLNRVTLITRRCITFKFATISKFFYFFAHLAKFLADYLYFCLVTG